MPESADWLIDWLLVHGVLIIAPMLLYRARRLVTRLYDCHGWSVSAVESSVAPCHGGRQVFNFKLVSKLAPTHVYRASSTCRQRRLQANIVECSVFCNRCMQLSVDFSSNLWPFNYIYSTETADETKINQSTQIGRQLTQQTTVKKWDCKRTRFEVSSCLSLIKWCMVSRERTLFATQMNKSIIQL